VAPDTEQLRKDRISAAEVPIAGSVPDPRPDPDRIPAGLAAARWAGLIGGAIAFIALLLIPPPAGLEVAGWRMAAVALLMAIWWMTEAVPIEATALLPLVLFPVLGILPMSGAAAPYANELIFLFMGGFFIAMAMERWGLHRRIALSIVSRVGTEPRRLVLGFMLATAFLSMWISNTATVAMMLPVAIAVAEMFRPPDASVHRFATALMLGTAYAASIGGAATLIGTPPNAVLAGAASELFDVQIGFFQWMMVGVPFAAILLPIAWLLLVGVLYPPGELSGSAEGLIQEQRRKLGPMSTGERVVAVVFALTATAWIFRDAKTIGGIDLPGLATYFPGVTDATIAMAAAVVLFVIPVEPRRRQFALDWPTARRIPWGVLILFGGGLSLARAMEETGVAAWIGTAVEALGALPVILLLMATAALFIFLTEVSSNTATSTMAMPVMAGASLGLGIPALSLMAVAALSASMAFMLPVATPPNAIVFGSGYLTIPQMARAGVWLNVVSIALITLFAATLIPIVLGS
jgi:solute carrier family 13 (sodium-dependent dicarboxylate transporter), member 2/3/5